MKKIRLFIISLLLSVLSTLCVYAKQPDLMTESMSLSLNYEKGTSEFALYKVATFSETGKFKVEEPFIRYQLVLDGLDSEGWRALAETLEGYVKRDQIDPIDRQQTDAEGKIRWENLEKGLYLVLGEQTKDKQYLYTPMPTLVTLPNRMENGEWNSQVSISLKYNQEDIFQKKEMDLKVIKIWKDAENKKNRPKKIFVQLVKDGNIHDTVELNKENNWEYTWKQLPKEASWMVVEKDVPQNYTVTSAKEGKTFILTNTYVASKEHKVQEQNNSVKLPKTGQLWWPVPVLCILGIVLFMIGLKQYKK